MKGWLRIFELSKNEQLVVLIVMLVLIAIAFVGYEHRVHRAHVHDSTLPKVKTSPSPVKTENGQNN